jgi:ankyrin repeat protein
MLRKSLATLPATLDQTYDRILSAIHKDDAEYAISILRWLTFSARPLTVEEVAEVVAIDVARDPVFDRDEVLEDPLEVLDICSSLVTITVDEMDWREQKVVALAHYSVQEYLVSDRIKLGPAQRYSMQEVECHDAIATSSLKYLMELPQPFSKGDLETHVLTCYSALFWTSHIQKTPGTMEDTNQLAMTLFCKDNPAYLTWIRLYNPDASWRGPDWRQNLESTATPLYCAAQLGLSAIVRLLLSAGADANAQSGYYGNALQAASGENKEQVVRILLDRGADINARGGNYGSALQAASWFGEEQIVKLLIDRGADVNAEDGEYGSALQTASWRGHEQIVKLLIDGGADINARGGEYGSALQAASWFGEEHIVKLLIDGGADVNAEDGEYGSALQTASWRGHKQIVKLLINGGADINARGGEYGSALQAASWFNEEQIVKLLIDGGADANAEDAECGSALQVASTRGQKQIAKMLLDRGAVPTRRVWNTAALYR